MADKPMSSARMWEDNRPFLTDEQRETLEAALQAKGNSSIAPDSRSAAGEALEAASGGAVGKSKERKSRAVGTGKPKKGGAGGKGTWGTYMDTDGPNAINRGDPNYDSGDEPVFLEERDTYTNVEDYKADVLAIIKEYFEADDIAEAAEGLRELGHVSFHHHFVKKVVTTSLDRHDREREMASVLLSSLYVEVISADQMSKGFVSLFDSIDDLLVDVPDATSMLGLFMARAVVDDVISPAFVKRLAARIDGDSKGLEVLAKCDAQLAPRHAAERLLRCWGDGASRTVDGVKDGMRKLLTEYVDGGDLSEAARCLRELNVPFFHHEVVKKSLVVAIETKGAEGRMEALLAELAKAGVISESQMTKGFSRTADALDDLSLDNPNARETLQRIVADGKTAGWLEGAYQLGWAGGAPPGVGEPAEDDDAVREFKKACVVTLQEYFASADVEEVAARVRELDSAEYHRHFVKKAVTVAMDRNDREREMVSVLFSSLYPELLTSDEIGQGLTDLLRAADDLALDIPSAIDMVSMFAARCVVDDVVPPRFLPEVLEDLGDGSAGVDCVRAAGLVLNARHAAERVLRCWGGGACRTVDDMKDAMKKLLTEYSRGGTIAEASRLLRELNVPFFHHELVKKAVILGLEEAGAKEKVAVLLSSLAESGEVSASQVSLGVSRVREQLEDLCLDNPKARTELEELLALGRSKGWLK
mmetsp:Transcript_58763/g.187497  ORF Transcript_58763/g.187497 Transcript_58763/m.187497 type:complete len:703 (-) Transcript_58763:1595-3703(-)